MSIDETIPGYEIVEEPDRHRVIIDATAIVDVPSEQFLHGIRHIVASFPHNGKYIVFDVRSFPYGGFSRGVDKGDWSKIRIDGLMVQSATLSYFVMLNEPLEHRLKYVARRYIQGNPETGYRLRVPGISPE